MTYIDYNSEWSSRLNAAIHSEGYPVGSQLTREMQKTGLIKALPGYLLFCFCENQRAIHATPWEALDGVKPAQLYLIQKHHWFPDQVFSLSHEQLQLVLHEELCQIELPERAHQAVQSDIQYLGIPGMKLKRVSVMPESS